MREVFAVEASSRQQANRQTLRAASASESRNFGWATAINAAARSRSDL
ncbi:hypothetical protein EV696_1451, partial [Permianibacter aggregans]